MVSKTTLRVLLAASLPVSRRKAAEGRKRLEYAPLPSRLASLGGSVARIEAQYLPDTAREGLGERSRRTRVR